MTDEAERRRILKALATQHMDAIYEYALKVSDEIKQAALADPEFEKRIMEDAAFELSTPQAQHMRRCIAEAVSVAAEEMSFIEAKIVVKMLAMDVTQQESDQFKLKDC